nr:beta-glucosidase [Cellvibrio gilvus, Peptide Recombinant Partial, 11 aa] [Cellulomonas gilvus]
APEPAEPAQKP